MKGPVRAGAVARNEWRLLRSDPTFAILSTVMPIFLIVFMKNAARPILVADGVNSANGAEHAVPGQAVLFSLFFLLGNVGYAVLRDYSLSTWDRMRAGWAHPAEILLGKVAIPLLHGLAMNTMIFAVGVAVFDLRIRTSTPGVVTVGVAFVITIVCLGLALMSLCRTVMELQGATYLVSLVSATLGGAMTPLSTLPPLARHLAPATPSYWAMRGYEAAILPGGSTAKAFGSAGVLMCFAVAAAAIGLARFRADAPKVGWA